MASKLPVELLRMIGQYLEPSSYIEAHLKDDPAKSFYFDHPGWSSEDKYGYWYSGRQDLKDASLVCKSWHNALKELVFQHLHLSVARWAFNQEQDELDIENFEDMIEFLVENRDFLSKVVHGVTICIAIPEDEDEQGPFQFRLDLAAQDKEIASSIVEHLEPCNIVSSQLQKTKHRVHDPLHDLWAAVKWLLPTRVTLVGHGSALHATLLGKFFYNPCEPGFHHRRIRLISFSRLSKPSMEAIRRRHTPEPEAMPLNQIACLSEWSHLLLNEGSRFDQTWKGVEVDDVGGGEPNWLSFLGDLNNRWAGFDVFGHESSKAVTYVSEFASLADVEALLFDRLPLTDLDTIRFQMLPAQYDLEATLAHSGLPPDQKDNFRKHYMAQFPDYWLADRHWARWAKWAEEMVENTSPNHSAAYAYEFPDLAHDSETWDHFVDLVRRYPGSKLRADGPGRLIRPRD